MKKNKKILLKIILLGCIFSMALMGHHTRPHIYMNIFESATFIVR